MGFKKPTIVCWVVVDFNLLVNFYDTSTNVDHDSLNTLPWDFVQVHLLSHHLVPVAISGVKTDWSTEMMDKRVDR